MAERANEAGTYARKRYQAGLRRYRKRVRPLYLAFIAGAYLPLALLATLHQLDWLSFFAGLTSGALVAIAAWIHDDPPEFIAQWGRGAEAEARTETALKPLLQEGWKMRHDIDLGRGNADHLLLSPSGTGYLLETKAYAGQIRIEAGIVVRRFDDDPDTIRRTDLRQPLARLAERVSREWGRRQHRPAPHLRTIVVLWGRFAQQTVQDPTLSYVAGNLLVDHLKEQEASSRAASA
jgi:hypothetical protein